MSSLLGLLRKLNSGYRVYLREHTLSFYKGIWSITNVSGDIKEATREDVRLFLLTFMTEEREVERKKEEEWMNNAIERMEKLLPHGGDDFRWFKSEEDFNCLGSEVDD